MSAKKNRNTIYFIIDELGFFADNLFPLLYEVNIKEI